MYGRKYSELYDEHYDGPAVNKAEPFLVPGVAPVPFDPNDHAVPTDNEPWWKILMDFYSEDVGGD